MFSINMLKPNVVTFDLTTQGIWRNILLQIKAMDTLITP